jgi:hypothetical protein
MGRDAFSKLTDSNIGSAAPTTERNLANFGAVGIEYFILPQGLYAASDAAMHIPLVTALVATDPPLLPITFPPEVLMKLKEVPPVPRNGMFFSIAAATVSLFAPSGSDEIDRMASTLSSVGY